MDEQEIKKCGCGGEATEEHFVDDSVAIRCKVCGISSKQYYYDINPVDATSKAIAAWNKRDNSEMIKLVDELDGDLLHESECNHTSYRACICSYRGIKDIIERMRKELQDV